MSCCSTISEWWNPFKPIERLPCRTTDCSHVSGGEYLELPGLGLRSDSTVTNVGDVSE